MNRFLLIALLVGCKSGSYVTVEVDGIPCDATTLHVIVMESGKISDRVFAGADQLSDGKSSFNLDVTGIPAGSLAITIEARDPTDGLLGTTTITTELPGATTITANLGVSQCIRHLDAGVMLGDANLNCWISPILPSNFAPCAPGFPMAPATTIPTGSYNTDVGFLGGSPYTYNGIEVYLLHVVALDVSGTVTISGNRPLLIVSDGDVMIGGSISFSAAVTATNTGCVTGGPDVGANSGAGGGGGGFGGLGGNGGNYGAGADTQGGAIAPNVELVPLRPGCPGGAGGSLNGMGSAPGGNGGLGGGAIEISSKTKIGLASTGKIVVDGGPGLQGHADPTGCGVMGGGNAGAGCAAGGGGGGAGGAILVEAPMIDLTNASLCAVGGGGGEGAATTAGTAEAAIDGAPAFECSGGAGGTGNRGGAGGNGAIDASPQHGGRGNVASSNADGTVGPAGGGGGGGGVGRIRLHGAAFMTSGAISVPAAIVQ